MAVPRIGREKSDKSDVLKIADDLAAKSRILRRQAEEADTTANIDEAVHRLASLAAQQHASERSERDARAAEIRSQYVPLIERAERILADNTAAVAELGPFIRRLGDLDWKAVRARARNTSTPGSLHSTHTNLALLQRAVEDAMALLRGDERDLVRWLNEVKGFTGYEGDPELDAVNLNPAAAEASAKAGERTRQYAVNGLLGVMNDRATPLRSAVATIRKFLAAVAQDLDAGDVALVQEAN
jgi:hypothetical protein